jgi:hypothetical protein
LSIKLLVLRTFSLLFCLLSLLLCSFLGFSKTLLKTRDI